MIMMPAVHHTNCIPYILSNCFNMYLSRLLYAIKSDNHIQYKRIKFHCSMLFFFCCCCIEVRNKFLIFVLNKLDLPNIQYSIFFMNINSHWWVSRFMP